MVGQFLKCKSTQSPKPVPWSTKIYEPPCPRHHTTAQNLSQSRGWQSACVMPGGPASSLRSRGYRGMPIEQWSSSVVPDYFCHPNLRNDGPEDVFFTVFIPAFGIARSTELGFNKYLLNKWMDDARLAKHMLDFAFPACIHLGEFPSASATIASS